MLKQIEDLIINEGYNRIPSNKEELTVYLQEQLQFANVILLYDLRTGLFSQREICRSIKSQLIRQFMKRGYGGVHVLTLFCCEEEGEAKVLFEGDPFARVIECTKRRIVIPEGHVEDFYGLKNHLAKLLERDDTFTDDVPLREQDVAHIPLRERSYVNITLVAMNLLIFLICIFTGERIYDFGIMYAKAVVEKGRYYQILTSMFLHDPSSVDHIFGNMVLLYLIGDIVERKCGHFRYLVLYFVSGIMGNLFSLAYSYVQMDFVGSLGASGAVYGVVGALLWILICNRGRVEDITLVRTLFMIGYSLYLGFTSTNVNNAAHVGGILTGFVLAMMLYSRKTSEKWEEYRR